MKRPPSPFMSRPLLCPKSCLGRPTDGTNEKCKTLRPATHLTRQFLPVVRRGLLEPVIRLRLVFSPPNVLLHHRVSLCAKPFSPVAAQSNPSKFAALSKFVKAKVVNELATVGSDEYRIWRHTEAAS